MFGVIVPENVFWDTAVADALNHGRMLVNKYADACPVASRMVGSFTREGLPAGN